MLRHPIRIWRGITGALRHRPGIFASAATLVVVLSIFVPPAVLSIVRKPFDYFAFNPWLAELPAYIARHDISVQQKLDFIPNLALFWVSADSPFGGVEWGFAVTVGDLLRFVLLGVMLGLYFALVFYHRDHAGFAVQNWKLAQGGGASGAVASVLGISTGGCTVMGCGAPVIPVVGLAFAGLSSGTLVLLAGLSRVATAAVLVLVAAGIIYLGWHAGASDASGGTPPPATGRG